MLFRCEVNLPVGKVTEFCRWLTLAVNHVWGNLTKVVPSRVGWSPICGDPETGRLLMILYQIQGLELDNERLVIVLQISRQVFVIHICYVHEGLNDAELQNEMDMCQKQGLAGQRTKFSGSWMETKPASSASVHGYFQCYSGDCRRTISNKQSL